MKNFFTSNVLKLLEKHGMSPFALSERLGIHSSTVYRWLDPEISFLPRARTRVAIAEFFGVDPNALMYEDIQTNDVPPLPNKTNPAITPPKKERNFAVKTKIPLLNLSSDFFFAAFFGEDFETNDGNIVAKAEQWLPPLPDTTIPHDNLIAVKAEGDALAPDIKDGDIVYLEFAFNPEFQAKHGDYVLAEPKSDDKAPPTILRKLVKGDLKDQYWLTVTNPDWFGTRTVEGGRVYGRVVAIFRTV